MLVPPPPMPLGYHAHQRPKTKSSENMGIGPSPSRPLSPGQQFDQMKIHEDWAKKITGTPTDQDLKVRIHVQ